MQSRTLKDWISRAESARILGIDPTSVPAVVLAGGIAVRQLPGLADRYRRADVERVKAEAEAPAVAERGVA